MISSRMAVAVHILAYLAWKREEPSTSEKLAVSVNTNPVVVRRIMGSLREAGLVQAQPGAGGGSMLVRDPAQITLLEVYRAVEDGEDLFALHADPCRNCGIGSNIRDVLQGVFCRAHDAMQGVLREVTIADVFTALHANAGKCGEALTTAGQRP
jgi:Rrf2 family protein